MQESNKQGYSVLRGYGLRVWGFRALSVGSRDGNGFRIGSSTRRYLDPTEPTFLGLLMISLI